MTEKKPKKKLKRLLISLLILTDIVMIVGVIAYFLLVSSPKDYRPQAPDKAQQKQAEDTMWKRSEEYHNNMYETKCFSVRFSEQLLNTMLLHEETQEYFRELTGRSVELPRQPQLRLTRDTIEFMGRFRYKKIDFVMTVGLRVVPVDSGRLKLTMIPVKFGRLTVPYSMVQERLGRLTAGLEERELRNMAGKEKSANNADRFSAVLLELFERQEVIMDNEYQAFKGRRARITGIQVSKGQIELEFQPMLNKKQRLTDSGNR
ncbi:MAG: hypothetical protein KAJ52_00575 [Sedimentisphaerales bacterium]|nr:hypothetical protein [Sedimentisphaerales bacterium]